LSLGFFNHVGVENYFEELIYIPGNHDHHLWRMYQTQQCIIDPLNLIKTQKSSNTGLQVKQYPQVIPGYLDLTSASPVLSISKTNSNGNFLTGLTGKACLPVRVVYPNLYILYNDAKGEKSAAIATHGHLFDPGWNIVTDFLLPFFKNQMDLQHLSLATLEMLNSPVTEAWNYETAQMGAYDVIDTIYDQLLKGTYPPWLNDLLNVVAVSLKKELSALYSKAHWYEGMQDIVIEFVYNNFDKIKTKLLGCLKQEILDGVSATPRYDMQFIQKNQDRVENYIEMSTKYIKGESVGTFSRLIFGHTHVPLFKWPYKFKQLPQVIDFYNTGGWVNIDKTEFPLPLVMNETGDIEAINLLM
ncbi:MAG: hypothetical protein PVI90_19135, partial [Desulfobacteraceae bacterium]